MRTQGWVLSGLVNAWRALYPPDTSRQGEQGNRECCYAGNQFRSTITGAETVMVFGVVQLLADGGHINVDSEPKCQPQLTRASLDALAMAHRPALVASDMDTAGSGST